MKTPCKRVLDVLLATTALVVLTPLMAVIAALVWLDSPGAVIFAQERLGQHGKCFRLYKFRKFPIGWSTGGPGVTLAGDARMTRVGTILEKTKLDELPQLWNVLNGDMSFVGPRPESAFFSELFSGRYAAVLEQMPGIFGPTQHALPDEARLYPADEDPETYYRRVLFPRKAEIDLAYSQEANCLSDLGWIVRGIWISLVSAIDLQRVSPTYLRLFLLDLLSIELAWISANLLRFSGFPAGPDHDAFISGLWMLPLLLMLGLVIGGCYRHPPKFFSLVDALRLTSVVSFVWLFSYLLLMGYTSRHASLYLVPMGWFILIFLLLIPRIWFRIEGEQLQRIPALAVRKALIYGVGVGGLALASWMKAGASNIKLMGFLDDDPELRGKVASGFRIYGQESSIPTIKSVHAIDEIWVTFQLGPFKRERLERLCKQCELKLVVLTDLEPFSQGQGVRRSRHPRSMRVGAV
jgi:lipopolysaccharide/colanic/teichoic acid biosynthesis glycosyltransferase